MDVLLDVPMDGNCQFHALCHQLELSGQVIDQYTLHQNIVDYMEAHPDAGVSRKKIMDLYSLLIAVPVPVFTFRNANCATILIVETVLMFHIAYNC